MADKSEYDASRALGAYYDERARWVQVLGRPVTQKPPVVTYHDADDVEPVAIPVLVCVAAVVGVALLALNLCIWFSLFG